MDFSLGYIKSKERVLIRKFSSNEDQEDSRTVDMTDIEDFSLQGLFYDSENEESLPLLEPMKKFFPNPSTAAVAVDAGQKLGCSQARSPRPEASWPPAARLRWQQWASGLSGGRARAAWAI